MLITLVNDILEYCLENRIKTTSAERSQVLFWWLLLLTSWLNLH